MSQEKFDELFDTHYPQSGKLLREETRAKLREETYLALVESLSDINAVIEQLKELTPTKPNDLYDSIRTIFGLPIWQIQGMPMLNETYNRLTAAFRSAYSLFSDASEKRRGWLLRKDRLTHDELVIMRDAALQAATALKQWLDELDPRTTQQ